ncbi:MAG: hypothetical protein EBT81_10130, partial [Gammaproteobacteria bacterium]|nr:hypothetical protein [Gammaproteobacteria bacterium]
RPRAGRGGGRSHRRRLSGRRARRRAFVARRVLEAGTRTHRGAHRVAYLDRGGDRLSRGRNRLSGRSCARKPPDGAPRTFRLGVAQRRTRPGAARWHDRGDSWAAERRKIEPAQRTRRPRCRHRHASRGDHSRCFAGTYRDRRHAAARHRHRRFALTRRRRSGCRRSRGHPPRAHRDGARRSNFVRDRHPHRSAGAGLAGRAREFARRRGRHSALEQNRCRCTRACRAERGADPRANACGRCGARRAETHAEEAVRQLVEARAGELVAEELRRAQQALNEITGEFHADDLLGRIFGSFCIGK